ncbi:hypothetical protein ABBQ32_009351 [Trebouxia sp. C0010 RCD-2024]
MVSVTAAPEVTAESSIQTEALSFTYPGIDGRPLAGMAPVVSDLTLQIPKGSACLLIGPNGAGKTTFLKILGGKHMVPESAVTVLGQPPFHATSLTADGKLAYLGGNWDRDIAFAGYSVPLQGDFPASKMLNGLPGIDPERRAKLIEVLDINPNWRMHTVSDGQRRRVQICLGLLKPFDVLLLDEITVDLDVLGRADLMQFLKQECQQRGATIVYATHIFDGLETWPSHLIYLAGGKVQLFKPAIEVPELQQGQLLQLVERWLREEKRQRKQLSNGVKGKDASNKIDLAQWSNGWAPGRMTASIRDSSNTVMRM